MNTPAPLSSVHVAPAPGCMGWARHNFPEGFGWAAPQGKAPGRASGPFPKGGRLVSALSADRHPPPAVRGGLLWG